jgi:hypothetical protein
MAKEKKVKLSELDNVQLILQFQSATRRSWMIHLQQRRVSQKSKEHLEELRLKREVLRRLGVTPEPSRKKKTPVIEEDLSGGGGLFSGGGGQGGGMFSRG